MAKESIKFNEDRTFGDLIGAPFQFVFQEFKTLFLSILKYSSPFLLLTLIFFVTAFRQTGNFLYGNSSIGAFMVLGILSLFLAILAMTVTFYAYVSLYSKMGKGNFTINDVGDLLKKYVFKVFGGMLLMMVIIIPISFLVFIPYLGILIAYCGIFYIYVSLSFFMIIIVNEDETVGNSFSRSFELIKGKWWFTFAIYLVFGLIVGFSSYIVMLPFILIFSFAFTGLGGGTVLIVLAIILYMGLYLIMISLQHALVSFVYFKLKVIKEGPELMDRIDEITKEESDTVLPETNTNLSEEQSIEDEDDEEKNRFEEDDDFNRFKPKY